MQTPLPKVVVAALVIIAVSLLLIVYKLYSSPNKETEENVVYVDAASGKVYQKQVGPAQPVETTEEKLRREHPDGRTY